mmetsp:Transcript_11004/g.19408  ORF Transcript_11004/g.19408 Transcript_11004/m.19408 type:complete len:272 (+) Transcript_11004:1112-1927(+)
MLNLFLLLFKSAVFMHQERRGAIVMRRGRKRAASTLYTVGVLHDGAHYVALVSGFAKPRRSRIHEIIVVPRSPFPAFPCVRPLVRVLVIRIVEAFVLAVVSVAFFGKRKVVFCLGHLRDIHSGDLQRLIECVYFLFVVLQHVLDRIACLFFADNLGAQAGGLDLQLFHFQFARLQETHRTVVRVLLSADHGIQQTNHAPKAEDIENPTHFSVSFLLQVDLATSREQVQDVTPVCEHGPAKHHHDRHNLRSEEQSCKGGERVQKPNHHLSVD